MLSLCATMLAGSCVRRGSTTSGRSSVGTCDGACSHYAACKGSSDQALMTACVRECTQFYAVDGVADSAFLIDYQRLDCPAAISFIEGQSGTEPGSQDGGQASKAP